MLLVQLLAIDDFIISCCEIFIGYWWHWLDVWCCTSGHNYNSGRILTSIISHHRLLHDKKTNARKPRVLYCCYRIICQSTYKQHWELVAIATGYRLNGPGIEFRRGQNFPYLFRPSPRSNQRPLQWVLGLFGVKAAGAWCWPPTHSLVPW